MSVLLAMDKDRKDRHRAAACNRRRSRERICPLSEKIDDDTIAQGWILIADKTDDPSGINHAKHLAHACLVGDVHTDERAVLVDEAIHARRTLPLCHADDGKPRAGKRPAHEFPVAAVRGGKDRPLARSDCRTHLIHRARDHHIVRHALLHDGKAQHLHQHAAKAQTARTRNALRLLCRDREAAHDLLPCQRLALGGDEDPRQPCETFAQCHGGTMRQEADEATEGFHRIVGEHLSSSHAVPRVPFRGTLFFSPSRADGGSTPVRAAIPHGAAQGSPHKRRPRAYRR